MTSTEDGNRGIQKASISVQRQAGDETGGLGLGQQREREREKVCEQPT